MFFGWMFEDRDEKGWMALSFSSEAKRELYELPFAHRGCRIQELSAIAQGSAEVLAWGGNLSLVFHLESKELGHRVTGGIRSLWKGDVEPFTQENRRFFHARMAGVAAGRRQDVRPLLQLLGCTVDRGKPVGEPLSENRRECCKRSFLRGIFLACGSVVDPNKGHHLELVVKEDRLADDVLLRMAELGIAGRKIRRKGRAVVYLKDADAIGDFLILVGAHGAILAQENSRIVKEVRNRINRQVNGETANINKTVRAAVRQAGAIRFLMDHGYYQKLEGSLREMADLRLTHPDLSMAELGGLSDPPVGKSGVNHRLRHLVRLAQERGFLEEERDV